MRYVYTHFIPENVAPLGATQIVTMETMVDEDGKKIPVKEVGSIPRSRFGGFTRPTGEPDYSWMLWSDAHTNRVNPTWDSNNKLDNALTYAESVGCKFVIGCGDFTQAGFYRKNEGSENITLDDGTVIPPQGVWYDEAGMVEYNRIISKHSIPVFEIFGNHESMYKPITLDLARAKELTGIPATAYTVSSAPDSDEIVGTTVRPNRHADVGNDLFILCGQSSWSHVMSDDDFAWLGKTLKDKKDRLCIVAIHSYMEGDSGDADDRRENSVFDTWSKTAEFVALLKKYPNVILLHGHSHLKYVCQSLDPKANYATVKGYKSLHVPSLGKPRRVDTNASVSNDTPEDIKSSQCGKMDRYPDCIVQNAMGFGTTGKPTPIPLGTLKINT
jgi:predicted phosphodiesterase